MKASGVTLMALRECHKLHATERPLATGPALRFGQRIWMIEGGSQSTSEPTFCARLSTGVETLGTPAGRRSRSAPSAEMIRFRRPEGNWKYSLSGLSVLLLLPACISKHGANDRVAAAHVSQNDAGAIIQS
jgi:hypothetical protein